MGRTPRELARSVTSAEFTWLKAYFNVEPFGFEIENFRAGVVASTVARAHGAKVGPADFYPKIGQPVEVDGQSQADQMRTLMLAAQTTEPS